MNLNELLIIFKADELVHKIHIKERLNTFYPDFKALKKRACVVWNTQVKRCILMF